MRRRSVAKPGRRCFVTRVVRAFPPARRSRSRCDCDETQAGKTKAGGRGKRCTDPTERPGADKLQRSTERPQDPRDSHLRAFGFVGIAFPRRPIFLCGSHTPAHTRRGTPTREVCLLVLSGQVQPTRIVDGFEIAENSAEFVADANQGETSSGNSAPDSEFYT